MTRFKRNIAVSPPENVSLYRLPMKGSNHLAFAEMNFRWRGPVNNDDALRSVVMPDGFTLDEVSGELFEIRDEKLYPRAVVRSPLDRDRKPSIVPLKRFSADTEQVADGWKMLIREWGRVIIRGEIFSSSEEAVDSAKRWLDSNKVGWESYTARVNFRGKPPEWKLFE